MTKTSSKTAMRWIPVLLAMLFIGAQGTHAAGFEINLQTGSSLPFMALSLVVSVTVLGLFLRLFGGVINHMFLHAEPIESIEKRQPYLPSFKAIIGTFIGGGALLVLSFGTLQNILPGEGTGQTAFILCAFAVSMVILCFVERRWRGSQDYVFSVIIGSVISLVLLAFQQSLFNGGIGHNPFFTALSVLSVIALWRTLFGPWEAHIKTTVLGTFIAWIAVFLLSHDPETTRLARILATIVAIIPAMVWAGFFLRYQRQQISMVLLMFFAGMLSTAPILFYDKLVRNGAEMQFFFFRVVPENFNQTSSVFVTGNLMGITGVRSTLMTALVSFLLVGLIEEVSKFWVMRKSGKKFFSSIDDAMQLSIIVAIGFAFAENVLNPTYFMSFVQQHLMGQPDWGAFLGNVLGRAILTNMVHIVSTGVFGYFFGLALFAGPYLQEEHRKGRIFLLADGLHSLLGFPNQDVFRRQMMVIGACIAIFLHGFFNFLVTFPDILPNNPRSIGDLIGSGAGGFLDSIPLLLIPSLFYVVGGFWLLTEIFYRKENMKERGLVVTADTLVQA